MSARRSPIIIVGLAAAATLLGLVVSPGTASAAGIGIPAPKATPGVTAKQCEDGGGKVVRAKPVGASSPTYGPQPRSHVAQPSHACSGGKYNGRYIA